MKKLITFIYLLLTWYSIFSPLAFADTTNLKEGDTSPWVNRTEAMWLTDAKNWWGWWFFDWWKVWEAWAKWLLFTVAKDLKNVFIAVAVIYFFVLVLRLFFWQWSEDDMKKLRIWILWTTIWIITMQMAYTAVIAMYDKGIWSATAIWLSNAVIIPIIRLLEVVTSFIFIAMAIMAFFKIIWSGWNEDGYKKWINTVINAFIWFILVKVSARLVYSIYWEVNCDTTMLWTQQCTDPLKNPNLTDTAKIIASVLKYSTWFIWIIVIILIIWAGFLMISSSWDEAKSKKAKSILKYIITWVILIAVSVGLFNFIIWKDITWVVWKFK